MALPPSQEDIDEWADRERRRRQAWLEGPTEYEKEAYARRRSARLRRGYVDEEYPAHDPLARSPRLRRDYGDEEHPAHDPLVRRVRRDQRLALSGLAGLFFDWPARAAASLVREGFEYEDSLDDPAYRRVPRFYREREPSTLDEDYYY